MDQYRSFGVRYTPENSRFSLWAPSSREVSIRLFSAGSEDEKDSALTDTIPMTKEEDGVFTAVVPRDLRGVYYTYLLTGSDGKTIESADPWATACGVNGQRSMVADLRATDPEGWEQDRRIGNAGMAPVIWETNVSDFSHDAASGVREAWRGKYLGFTEPEREGSYPTRLSYLRQLGVTHIQLQPIADYFTVDETGSRDYNWGYDIENYNVPEGSFSTDPWHGEVRIRECKQMIQAIHRAGLGVILDVVYNHTYHKNSWLNRTAPGEYYRMGADGFLNASGCGTETESERFPFRNYMLQSVLYWAKEYHVDGFRFDLMAIHDVETMNLIRSELDKLPGGKDIFVYGEPWSALPVTMKKGAVSANQEALPLLSERIGIFSDTTKCVLAGTTFDVNAKGWATGAPQKEQLPAVRGMLTGYCREDQLHFAKDPGQIVHYVSCHDNYTLWDRLVTQSGSRCFDGEDTAAERRNRLASAVVLLSLGIGFIQGGEEFCRTKHGNGNTYNGPAAENSLKWPLVLAHMNMVSWYRGLISIRRELYPRADLEAAGRIRFLEIPTDAVAMAVDCLPACRWQTVVAAFNPCPEERLFQLPEGEWTVLCDGMNSEVWKTKQTVVSGKVSVPSETALIWAKVR